jgi:hypothetical protein
MSGTTQTNVAGLFAGTLYLSELDPDTNTYGAFFKVETDKLEIKAPSDLLEAISKSRENYGQAHTSYAKAKPSEISLNFTAENKKILAAKLAGIVVDGARAASALSGVSVKLLELDGWVEIGTAHLSETGLTVKASADAGTPYVKGTDYEINPRLGLIRPLSGGAIAANATVYLTGSAPALTGETIQGASRYLHEYKGYLDGLNLVTNEDVVVNLPRVSVTTSDAKDFLDEKLSTTALTGRLLIPTDGSKPYSVDFLKATT